MQIPLELKLPVKAELKDFVSPDKEEIQKAIEKLIQSHEHSYVYIGGATGSGKTHLLSSLCQLAEEHEKSVIYLPLKNVTQLSTQLCEGLEQADVICIDDIHSITGNSEWEQAVFHLYNNIRLQNHQLVITGNNTPANIEVELPDLKSRLSWGISLFIKPLDDEHKKQVLQNKAEQMAMPLPDETVNYLLRHHSRTMGKLLETLNSLERASMAAKRKLTVPFVKSVLENQS